MSLTVFFVVLAAAAIHASWNAILKGAAGNALMTTIMVAGVSGAISAFALPFLPPPAPASYPYLAVTTVVQLGYYVLLANAYRVGDMSRTYPIMRGTAPLLLVGPAVLFLGETIGPAGWIGMALVSAGILSLLLVRPAQGAARPSPAGAVYALLNAVTIATYTFIDGAGVRVAGSLSYILWLFILTGGLLVLWALVARRAQFIATVRSSLPRATLAGLGNLASYALILWAMTQAPIPLVAALRETSILFGTAIAALVLHEKVGPWRIAAACIIATGAMTLRLG